VSLGLFAILFVGAASVLAAWSYVRFAERAPRDLRSGMLHLGASLVICRVVSPVAGSVLASWTGGPSRLIFVVGVALPALSYAILSLCWLIALIQGAIARGSLR
jgi:hypothetical protein